MRGKLELQDDDGGLRHYLDGEPVHCGTGLQLLIASADANGRGEVWCWVRYESALTRERPGAMLYTRFGRVLPDDKTILRWPPDDDLGTRLREVRGGLVQRPLEVLV